MNVPYQVVTDQGKRFSKAEVRACLALEITIANNWNKCRGGILLRLIINNYTAELSSVAVAYLILDAKVSPLGPGNAVRRHSVYLCAEDGGKES